MIESPEISAEQEASWLALLEVQRRVPIGWTLVGGQMVHLHCLERGSAPSRPTDDVDTVLDVRAEPTLLGRFTTALTAIGFTALTSADDVQHRWVRGAAVIDVMLPDGVGHRTGSRIGAGGSRTIEARGGTQALARTHQVTVSISGVVGSVLRPSLLGALVIKAAAHDAGGSGMGRHRLDFAVLASLVTAADLSTDMPTPKDRRLLQRMVDACRRDGQSLAVEGAEYGLRRLEIGLARTVAK